MHALRPCIRGPQRLCSLGSCALHDPCLSTHAHLAPTPLCTHTLVWADPLGVGSIYLIIPSLKYALCLYILEPSVPKVQQLAPSAYPHTTLCSMQTWSTLALVD